MIHDPLFYNGGHPLFLASQLRNTLAPLGYRRKLPLDCISDGELWKIGRAASNAAEYVSAVDGHIYDFDLGEVELRYYAALVAVPDEVRRRWLEGDWDNCGTETGRIPEPLRHVEVGDRFTFRVRDQRVIGIDPSGDTLDESQVVLNWPEDFGGRKPARPTQSFEDKIAAERTHRTLVYGGGPGGGKRARLCSYHGNIPHIDCWLCNRLRRA